MIIGIIVISIVTGILLNHQMNPNSTSLDTTTASAQKVTAYHMFYSVSTPQEKYILKQGQTITIPVSVFYTERDALHVISLIHVNYCGPVKDQMSPQTTNPEYQIPKLCNMVDPYTLPEPSDMTVTLDKKSFDFQATATNETTSRDVANLTVSSLPDTKTGVYRIAIGLTTDGNGVHSQMVYLDVL